MGYVLMIWEMTVSIWSSPISTWDILSLWMWRARSGRPYLRAVLARMAVELQLHPLVGAPQRQRPALLRVALRAPALPVVVPSVFAELAELPVALPPQRRELRAYTRPLSGST